MAELTPVRMHGREWRQMYVCGLAPLRDGQRVIIVRHEDGNDCFAARLTPSGWQVITEPVQLYPIL